MGLTADCAFQDVPQLNVFQTASVVIPFYDLRRKDFLINTPLPMFCGDSDTGGCGVVWFGLVWCGVVWFGLVS